MGKRLAEFFAIFCQKDTHQQAVVIRTFHAAFMDTKKRLFSSLLSELDGFIAELWSASSYYKDIDIGLGKDEATLRVVFKTFSRNDKPEYVLPKVVLLNELYHAGLYDTDGKKMASIREMTRHIISLAPDISEWQMSQSDQRDYIIELVKKLGDRESIGGTLGRKNVDSAYSFASKYLSFTALARDGGAGNDGVPITDTYARCTLSKWAKAEKEPGLIEAGLESYQNYYDSVIALKERYVDAGENISLKEIDAFLWILGKAFHK